MKDSAAAAGAGARTAIWVRTGAALWCQAATGADGGQTKRSSGAGEASGLRLRRHFPVWSGMWVSAVRPGRSRASVASGLRLRRLFPARSAWVSARLFRQELGRCGSGTGLFAAIPPSRRLAVSPCCRAVRPFPSVRFPGACRSGVSLCGGRLRSWLPRPAPERRAEAVRGPESCATLLAASFRRAP